MCGIYAYKEKPRLLREIRNIYSGLRLVANNRYVPIYGEINLWGKVIEHEDGYRAQFGYPKRLWCTPAIEPLAGWLAGWLDWLCLWRAMRSNAVGRRRRNQNQLTEVYHHEICLRALLSRRLLSEVFCAEHQSKTKGEESGDCFKSKT